MLSVGDVRAFLQGLQKDFRLIVDNKTYLCNRQNLCAFSTVIRAAVAASPTITEFSLFPNVSHSIADEIISFLHGGDLDPPPDSSLFDYFYFGASLGIDIIANRLTTEIFKSLTPENLTDRFHRLSAYPTFCVPIILFLNAHQSIFTGFVRSNDFHPDFVRSLLSARVNIFPTEDDRFIFIRRYNTALPSPNLTLYNLIHPEDLTKQSINALIIDPDITHNCKTFPLLLRLLREIRDLSERQSSIADEITLFERRLSDLDNQREEIRRIEDSTSTLSATLKIESQIRRDSSVFADQLDLISACVSLLAVSDEKAKELISMVPRLLDLVHRMSIMMTSFQKAGGWVLYPKSCEAAAEATKGSTVALKSLQPLTANFILNRKVVFQYATSLAMIAEGLRN
jgi:hypothetical protein